MSSQSLLLISRLCARVEKLNKSVRPCFRSSAHTIPLGIQAVAHTPELSTTKNSCGSPQVPLPMMMALSPAKQEKIQSICVRAKPIHPGECDMVVRHLVSAVTDDTTDTHNPAPAQGCAGAAASCSCSCSYCCQLSQLPYMAACPVVAVLMICKRAVKGQDGGQGRAAAGGSADETGAQLLQQPL